AMEAKEPHTLRIEATSMVRGQPWIREQEKPRILPTEKIKMTKPQYNDYPITACMETVKPFVEAGCHFNQKWSCAHCGSRQTMAQPDQFFASGQCEECGHVTDLKHRG